MSGHHNNRFNRQDWLNKSHKHFLKVAPGYDAGRAFERGRFWAREIAARVPLTADDNLLDVGCGTGLFALPFAETLPCQVYGIDPSPIMLAEALKKDEQNQVIWTQGDAEDLPFPDETFQAIFLSQVWHHLLDEEVAAREFNRVLKPGGKLFVKTFSHEQLRGRWDLKTVFPELMPFMLNIYPDVPDFKQLLTQFGFNGFEHQSYCKEDWMQPSAMLKVADKKLWSMFSFISEEGREEGMAYLRDLIVTTEDEPVAYDENHLLICAQKRP